MYRVIILILLLFLVLNSFSNKIDNFNNYNKYIYLKGAEGFGDRLQCLLECIEVSLNQNRIIIVDWRDSQWTHNPEHDFNFYFSFDKKIPTMKLEELKNRNIKSIFPKYWEDKEKIFNIIDRNDLYRDDCKIKKDNKWIKDIEKNDLIVHPCVGYRIYTYENIKYINLKKHVLDYIKESLKEIGILKKKYIAVHLRGGDRLKNKMEKEENYTKEMYINEIFEKFKNKVKDYKGEVVVLSDEQELVNMFSKKYKKPFKQSMKEILSNKDCLTKLDEGLHNIDMESLPCKDLKRDDLNLNMLRDFIILCNSEEIIFDEVSTFSLMATQIKNSNVKNILGFNMNK